MSICSQYILFSLLHVFGDASTMNKPVILSSTFCQVRTFGIARPIFWAEVTMSCIFTAASKQTDGIRKRRGDFYIADTVNPRGSGLWGMTRVLYTYVDILGLVTQ